MSQDVKVTISADDRASGPIKNVQGALDGLEKTTESTSGGFSGLAAAASVAAGTIISDIGKKAVRAVQDLAREMIDLTSELHRFQSQTQNILKNLGFENLEAGVYRSISAMENLWGVSDTKLLEGFNTLMIQTKDVEAAYEGMAIAADLAAAMNLDFAMATRLVQRAMEGDVTALRRYGIMLDETALKTMNAEQRFQYFKETVQDSMSGAAEAFRQSSAGAMENFQNQIGNMKKEFGEGILNAISPVLEQVSDKILNLISSERLKPLTDAFGDLFEKLVHVGMELGQIIFKLTGVSDTDAAIRKISDAFERLAFILGVVRDTLERIRSVIQTLHLDKAISTMARIQNPIGMYVWDESGRRVAEARATEAAFQYTPHEAFLRSHAGSTSHIPLLPETSKDTAADALSRLRESARLEVQSMDATRMNTNEISSNTSSTKQASEMLAHMRNNTANCSNAISQLGSAAASAISRINSAAGRSSSGGTTRSGCVPAGHIVGPDGGYYEGSGAWVTTVAGGHVIYDGPSSGHPNPAVSGARTTHTTPNRDVVGATFGEMPSGGAWTSGGGTWSVNDALITKRGDIVRFNPDDNILAYKDPNALRKGVVINNTFNIEGGGDPERIADEIMRRINRITRVGF